MLQRQTSGRLTLGGQLDMDSVAALAPQLSRALQGGNEVLDLAAVTHADSAALALLLGCVRQQQQAGGSLQLQGVPPALAKLAALYGVAPLLGLAPSGEPT